MDLRAIFLDNGAVLSDNERWASEWLIALTRNTYSGAVEVGEDSMTIEVGEQVYVSRFVP